MTLINTGAGLEVKMKIYNGLKARPNPYTTSFSVTPLESKPRGQHGS